MFLKKKCVTFESMEEGEISAVLEFLNILWGLGTEEKQATQGGIHSLESVPGLHKRLKIRALEFLNNESELGTEQEQSCRTGPPGYIGCRNKFLGIDSQTP